MCTIACSNRRAACRSPPFPLAAPLSVRSTSYRTGVSSITDALHHSSTRRVVTGHSVSLAVHIRVPLANRDSTRVERLGGTQMRRSLGGHKCAGLGSADSSSYCWQCRCSSPLARPLQTPLRRRRTHMMAVHITTASIIRSSRNSRSKQRWSVATHLTQPRSAQNYTMRVTDCRALVYDRLRAQAPVARRLPRSHRSAEVAQP